MTYTIVVDTGGTFTDLVLADQYRLLGLHKAPTTPQDVFEGIEAALGLAAAAEAISVATLLERTTTFVYATTHATNAVLEGRVARTAFLCTEGHPDVLVYREGGKPQPLNIALAYPEPYVPRSLTFELPERILADGSVLQPLDEARVRATLLRLAELRVEAVGVCLLWSVSNPAHELRVGDLLDECLPDVPYTLSHRLNPVNREYRRASAAVIDASLKPILRGHLHEIDRRLRALGFAGDPLTVSHTSGGVQPMHEMAEQPLYCVDSGPVLAPIAALSYARLESEWPGGDLVVIDAGGTSCDVSLARDGAVVHTREKWLGPRFTGHMTGLPAVDTCSIGAGGGSIAAVDPGGLLRVGPHSAGAAPGPACYGRGGSEATVTDAALVTGRIDPTSFLGGRMPLDGACARAALARSVAAPLGLELEAAAVAVLRVYTENVRAFVFDAMMSRGLDPRETLLVAGGGAAGLNVVEVARELRCPALLVPRLAAGLSAVGGQHSDILGSFSRALYSDTSRFESARVNELLREIHAEMDRFLARVAPGAEQRRELFCEARYAHQLWELSVPLGALRAFEGPEDVVRLRRSFDRLHREIFAVEQPDEPVEILHWRGEARALRPKPGLLGDLRGTAAGEAAPRWRGVWFGDEQLPTLILSAAGLEAGAQIEGPAVIEEPTTTLVLPPRAQAAIRATHYWIRPGSDRDRVQP